MENENGSPESASISHQGNSYSLSGNIHQSCSFCRVGRNPCSHCLLISTVLPQARSIPQHLVPPQCTVWGIRCGTTLPYPSPFVEAPFFEPPLIVDPRDDLIISAPSTAPTSPHWRPTRPAEVLFLYTTIRTAHYRTNSFHLAKEEVKWAWRGTRIVSRIVGTESIVTGCYKIN